MKRESPRTSAAPMSVSLSVLPLPVPGGSRNTKIVGSSIRPVYSADAAKT